LKKGTVVTSALLYSEGAWVQIDKDKWCAATFSGMANMKVKTG